MQRLAQHYHALIRVVGHIKSVWQRNPLTKGDSGTRPGRNVFQRYGAAGVFLIGALPLPFAAGTWTAGAMRCHFGKVALACLVRYPKTAALLAIITTGFNLGGAA